VDPQDDIAGSGVRWAVERLAVQPSDRVLEIGCGSGVAAAIICERLVEGQMLAIDRSEIQIERARRRNEAHLASGLLSLQTVELADLDVRDARLDKVFAINVNLFWLGPARAELDSVRGTLAPGGRLFLFYETPGSERSGHAAERLTAVLRAQAFTEPEWLTPTPTLFGCVTAPRGGKRRRTRPARRTSPLTCCLPDGVLAPRSAGCRRAR
jgi:SAM-dependent methyltransferase